MGLAAPAYGAAGRHGRMLELFDSPDADFTIKSHRVVYQIAREVAGGAGSPYAAAAALEKWFRTEGGFVYDETASYGVTGVEPPLVTFLRSRHGYCQMYAGAMTLMLRMLGIPSRQAAGFTNGEYNAQTKTWTVTDHRAHTWVEVFFPGFGWLPFDPTPGRGELDAAYSPVSESYLAGDAAVAFAAAGGSPTLDALRIEALRSEQLEGAAPFAAPGGGGATGFVTERGPNVLSVVALLAAGAVALLLAAKALRRALLFRRRDPRALAAACRRDLAGFLADQRVAVPEGVTPTELGTLLERDFVVDAKPFVRALGAARFGPPAAAADAVAVARRELRTLRRRMRRQLGRSDRARGALSLRSFSA